MISNELIEKECEALKRSIKKKQRYVREAPDGTLRVRKSRGHYYWYVLKHNALEELPPSDENETCESINHQLSGDKSASSKHQCSEYINKSDLKLAEKMALKSMYIQDLLDEKQELKALESFLRNRSKFERREKFLSRSEGIMELVQARLKSKWSTEVEAWLGERMEYDVPNPEGRKFRCKNGMMVRSKSERDIVNALVDHDVPFKYEEPCYLGDHLYLPDFTILNARTGKEYVWEHFGMMDDPGYYEKNLKKIYKYFENGYVPFINLITTYEVGNSGIDGMWVERIIETYLK